MILRVATENRDLLAFGLIALLAVTRAVQPSRATKHAGSLLRFVRLRPLQGGAACLDGSPYGYYFRQGDPSRFHIGLDGGGVCTDADSCEQRLGTAQGTSTVWPKTRVMKRSIASDEMDHALASWTAVVLPYCDGMFFAANRSDSLGRGSKRLWFRGRANVDAVLQSLRDTHGMGKANDILLWGESAGGFAVYNNLDRLAASFPAARVRGLADAAFNLAMFDYSTHVPTLFTQAWANEFNMVNSADNSCVAAAGPQDGWRCLFDNERVYRHLTTPVFVVRARFDCAGFFLMSEPIACLPAPLAYDLSAEPYFYIQRPACGAEELARFHSSGWQVLQILNRSGALRGGALGHNGLYSDACVHHSMTSIGDYWNSRDYMIQGATLAQAVGAWLEAPRSEHPDPGAHIHVDESAWSPTSPCSLAFESCLGALEYRPDFYCGSEPWKARFCA